MAFLPCSSSLCCCSLNFTLRFASAMNSLTAPFASMFSLIAAYKYRPFAQKPWQCKRPEGHSLSALFNFLNQLLLRHLLLLVCFPYSHIKCRSPNFLVPNNNNVLRPVLFSIPYLSANA